MLFRFAAPDNTNDTTPTISGTTDAAVGSTVTLTVTQGSTVITVTTPVLAGGTYTVSNVGSFGNVMGTPIIMQPQVAIMAVGAIKKKPAVIETPEGDLIGIRHFMFLSHSYDHRVVDGAVGSAFLQTFKNLLENPVRILV